LTAPSHLSPPPCQSPAPPRPCNPGSASRVPPPAPSSLHVCSAPRPFFPSTPTRSSLCAHSSTRLPHDPCPPALTARQQRCLPKAPSLPETPPPPRRPHLPRPQSPGAPSKPLHPCEHPTSARGGVALRLPFPPPLPLSPAFASFPSTSRPGTAAEALRLRRAERPVQQQQLRGGGRLLWGPWAPPPPAPAPRGSAPSRGPLAPAWRELQRLTRREAVPLPRCRRRPCPKPTVGGRLGERRGRAGGWGCGPQPTRGCRERRGWSPGCGVHPSVGGAGREGGGAGMRTEWRARACGICAFSDGGCGLAFYSPRLRLKFTTMCVESGHHCPGQDRVELGVCPECTVPLQCLRLICRGLARLAVEVAWSECKDDFLFKFLVIGNAGTGKSCLLHQFIEKKFKDDSNHTIGVEFGSKIINVGGKYVKLQIWDTAGQERFRSVTRSYYRGAAGALLVYDITSRETYNALTNWLTDARMLASQNIVIILCGNKKDLDADREVTFLEASRFAQENGNALTGENVEEAFVQCARKILNKIESGELDPERMGSGIQYGDAALRQLRSPRRSQAPSAQDAWPFGPEVLSPGPEDSQIPSRRPAGPAQAAAGDQAHDGVAGRAAASPRQLRSKKQTKFESSQSVYIPSGRMYLTLTHASRHTWVHAHQSRWCPHGPYVSCPRLRQLQARAAFSVPNLHSAGALVLLERADDQNQQSDIFMDKEKAVAEPRRPLHLLAAEWNKSPGQECLRGPRQWVERTRNREARQGLPDQTAAGAAQASSHCREAQLLPSTEAHQPQTPCGFHPTGIPINRTSLLNTACSWHTPEPTIGRSPDQASAATHMHAVAHPAGSALEGLQPKSSSAGPIAGHAHPHPNSVAAGRSRFSIISITGLHFWVHLHLAPWCTCTPLPQYALGRQHSYRRTHDTKTPTAVHGPTLGSSLGTGLALTTACVSARAPARELPHCQDLLLWLHPWPGGPYSHYRPPVGIHQGPHRQCHRTQWPNKMSHLHLPRHGLGTLHHPPLSALKLSVSEGLSCKGENRRLELRVLPHCGGLLSALGAPVHRLPPTLHRGQAHAVGQ
ncbi:Ras-related protein Rab-4A, partial [Galemys pyrenaicus]